MKWMGTFTGILDRDIRETMMRAYFEKVWPKTQIGFQIDYERNEPRLGLPSRGFWTQDLFLTKETLYQASRNLDRFH